MWWCKEDDLVLQYVLIIMNEVNQRQNMAESGFVLLRMP